MNARNHLHTPLPLASSPVGPVGPEEAGTDLLEYWDIIADNRRLIAIVTAVALIIGAGYAFLARPVYEANLLIQVEDSSASAKSFLGDAATLFDVKTPAAAEIEIIRSRFVIGKAVDNTLLYISAYPRHLPIIGSWLARNATGLSNPGIFGYGGFVTGTEKIGVTHFEVPRALEDSKFRLIARSGGQYVLSNSDLDQELVGTVGQPLERNTSLGPISLLVTRLEGKPGAAFTVIRYSRLETIEELQKNLNLNEKGRQSGIIDVRLQSAEPTQLTQVLNEIGKLYVRQNIERKAAEAEKMLAFVDTQLPQFKKLSEDSEAAYARYRNQQGTVALDAEAQQALEASADLQGKLLDAEQKRRELVSRFTAEHPAVKTLDAQISDLKREIGKVENRIHAMPVVQQNALRLQRDATVNNEAYQNLRNNALQLQLTREGKVGNVRLLDQAAVPEVPVKPKRPLVFALAGILGLLCGVAFAFARNSLFRGIRDPQEIEAATGLGVYSTIPLSPAQNVVAEAAMSRQGIHLLAVEHPQDPAIESLRSLRTALQFAMLEADNNRVLITGATPAVGKSFVSCNFAAVLAAADKRVLLVDADMRKGHLNHNFGVPRERGLSELVAGTLKLSEAIKSNLLPNLDLLTTGVLPPNPAELMQSSALAHLLDELSSLYDYVILDTPPVLVAADTLGAAAHAGTVLLVARAGQTQIGELTESSKRLRQAGKSVGGVLFNAMDLSRRHYGSYGYKYGGYRYRQYSYETPAK
jgi:tyrosine-protein kinase Etk/Wzc